MHLTLNIHTTLFTILLFAGVAVFSYIYKALDSYGVKMNKHLIFNFHNR